MIETLSEFVTWSTLATYGGCLAMVLILVQLTKEIPGVKQIPTQLWSWFLAVLILLAAQYFAGTLTAETAVLSLFNAAIVSLAANGGFEAIQRIRGGDSND